MFANGSPGTIFASSAEVQACCEEWQKRLRLQDWEIKCRLAEDWDLGANLGRNVPNYNDKTATIDVNKITFNGLRPHDHEHTLVHELVHLLTRPIVRVLSKNHEEAVEEEELAINLITSALLALERGAE